MTTPQELRQAAAQAKEALADLCGPEGDPNNGWRGRGTTTDFTCEYCGRKDPSCVDLEHSPTCPVPKARAALSALSAVLEAPTDEARSGSGVPARPTLPGEDAPIDMVLHCPVCGLQHVDAPEPGTEGMPWSWDNPPHKSHLCHRCGHIWRPADVPTNGVLETKTRGSNDSFTSMLGTPKTAGSFDEFFDREYPNVEDRQGRFRDSNGYQLCWRGWEAATERAAAICRGVNNHDNPLTANDCADEIEKGLEP